MHWARLLAEKTILPLAEWWIWRKEMSLALIRLTTAEMSFVASKKCDGITRFYASRDCPFEVKDNVFLCLPHGGPGSQFAVAKIISVRKESVDFRRSSDELARRDGFSNAQSWWNHFKRLYPMAERNGSMQTYRFRLQMIKEITPAEQETLARYNRVAERESKIQVFNG